MLRFLSHELQIALNSTKTYSFAKPMYLSMGFSFIHGLPWAGLAGTIRYSRLLRASNSHKAPVLFSCTKLPGEGLGKYCNLAMLSRTLV